MVLRFMYAATKNSRHLKVAKSGANLQAKPSDGFRPEFRACLRQGLVKLNFQGVA